MSLTYSELFLNVVMFNLYTVLISSFTGDEFNWQPVVPERESGPAQLLGQGTSPQPAGLHQVIHSFLPINLFLGRWNKYNLSKISVCVFFTTLKMILSFFVPLLFTCYLSVAVPICLFVISLYLSLFYGSLSLFRVYASNLKGRSKAEMLRSQTNPYEGVS